MLKTWLKLIRKPFNKTNHADFFAGLSGNYVTYITGYTVDSKGCRTEHFIVIGETRK
jgi:predicted house-cleaning NTP pyrophosphatase (Maf/HAM1 superfamily)